MWPTTCEGPAAGGLHLHVACHTTGDSRTVNTVLAIDAGPVTVWLNVERNRAALFFQLTERKYERRGCKTSQQKWREIQEKED